MKSTKFRCLVLMTKHIFKTMVMLVSSWLSELIIKDSYLNNYFKNIFCQAYCFNFQSNQDGYFSIYKNIVRLLVWHIKFEKCKALEKKISEELIPIA